MTNELATLEDMDLSEVQGLFDVGDNIKGITGRIPQVKIIHQAQMFSNQDGTQKFEKFTGIIVHHTAVNAFWANSFDETGGGTLPTCSSMDGEAPNVAEPQSKYCYDCPQNQWGSAGKGKACKNSWRLHILPEEGTLPKRMTVPPALIGAVQDFFISLVDMKVPHELAVVEFTLAKTKNKDGIEYSMIRFKVKGVITQRQRALQIKKLKEQFANAFGEGIDSREMANSTDMQENTKVEF